MARLRVGVVGVGHLGKEHARILSGMSDVTLVGVADPDPTRAEAVALRCGTKAFADHRNLLNEVDAVVVAAPTAHHHAVACQFLRRGTPVLVEKPLAADAVAAEELVVLADRQGAVLQVGHVERFNPAFEELCRRPLCPKYIHCERYSGFSGRSTDVGVVLDLMIHDIDLVLSLTSSPVESVWAMGVAVLGGNEDVARARVTFTNGCVVDFAASRVNPAPVRRMQVWGAEGYAGLDFAKRHLTLVQPTESIRHGRIDSRRLDAPMAASLKAELFGRHLQTQELDCSGGDQLTAELNDFVAAIRNSCQPRVTGAAGRDAVLLATSIVNALQQHSWDGGKAGCIGAHNLPQPTGVLFTPPADQAAA
jgi:predicted dehydrogenase